MRTLTVDLGTRSYPIHIGKNLLSNSKLFTPKIASSEVVIITNKTVAPLYLESLLQALDTKNIHESNNGGLFLKLWYSLSRPHQNKSHLQLITSKI